MKRFVKTLEPLSGLPNGFTEVEYLESTSGQYIDTGVVVKSNTIAKAVFSITSNVQGKSYFGARNSTNERFQIVNSFGVGAGYFYNTNVYPIVNKQFEIEMHASGEVYLDGIKRDATNGTFSAVAFDRTLYIFHTNYYDGSGTPTSSKFWKVQILEGDTLVRDFIPALDPSGKPCMYDKVEGKAYYNQSTGEFTYGPKIIPVEYLQSSGTQYIDTGCILSSDCKGEALAEYTGAPASGSSYIFGTYGGSKNFGVNTAGLTDGQSTLFYFVWAGVARVDVTADPLPVALNTKYHVVVSRTYMQVNNSEYTYNGATFTGSNSAYLFWANGTGQPKSLMKLYWTKFWDGNGTLVRDYIPVIDENNVGYMFDRINHTLYENKGTGSFSYGEKVYKPQLRLIEERAGLSRLPNGFTEVEYLQSSGTQYIDTGVNTTDNIGFYVSYSWNTFNTVNSRFLGVIKQNGSATYQRHHSSDSNTSFQYFVSNTGSQMTTTGTAGFHTIKYNSVTKKFSYDNTEINASSPETFDTELDYWLFGRNSNTESLKNYASVKIYSAKIFDGNNLVRDYIPVLDPSGRPCMYDRVEGKVYYNQGTGDDFSYGRQIIPVEYLESTGTQYIDTGHAFTDGFSWEIDFEGISDGKTLFGGRTSTTRTALLYQRNYGGIDLTTCPIAGYNGQETPFQLTDLRLGRHTIKMAVASNKGSVWVDNTQVYNVQSFTGTYISGTTQTLFADNFGTSVSEHTSSKVYALKMWQGSNIIRDYIPVIDENNVGYMFDKVTHLLYENKGTGSFSYGEKVYKRRLRLASEPWYTKKYDLLTYLESTGTQWIDTDLKGNLNTKIEATVYAVLNEHYAIAGDFTTSTSAVTVPINNGNAGLYSRFGNKAITSGIGCETGVHKIYVDKTGYYSDDVKRGTFDTTTAFTTTNTMMLFGFTGLGRNYLVGKMYYCKIWDGTTLVGYFRPAKRKSDNKYGMLDMVTKKFYTNAGTGDFTGE